jgi:HEAT repeats
MRQVDRVDDIEKARRQIKQSVLEDPVKLKQLSEHLAVAGPLLDELRSLGYGIDTLDDLRHIGRPWKTALPILLCWLPKIEDPDVKENIVRCLSVRWVGSEATAELIEEFRRYAPIDPVHAQDLSHLSSAAFIKYIGTIKPHDASASLAWAIGNALSIVSIRGYEKQIIELCRNPKFGTARQMVVLGLGRAHDEEAEETAVQLLNDEDVRLHAIIALGKMKSKRALSALELLLTDKQSSIRKEARKAITKIMR